MANVTITRAWLRQVRPAGTAGRSRGKRRRAPHGHDWADTLAAQIVAVGLPAPQRDQQLVLPRQFKTDLCWRDRHLFVECDGAVWTQGQHARGQGMTDDCVKWNLLTLAGWRGLRFTGNQVQSGYALATIERALERYPVIA